MYCAIRGRSSVGPYAFPGCSRKTRRSSVRFSRFRRAMAVSQRARATRATATGSGTYDSVFSEAPRSAFPASFGSASAKLAPSLGEAPSSALREPPANPPPTGRPTPRPTASPTPAMPPVVLLPLAEHGSTRPIRKGAPSLPLAVVAELVDEALPARARGAPARTPAPPAARGAPRTW